MGCSTKWSSLMRTFHKFEGAGNDFILFEDFENHFPESCVATLCHRRFGVGADGLILARHSEIADFKMVFFNADGTTAGMCGNGLRCFVHFLRDLGYVKPLYKIEIAEKVLTVKCNRSKIFTLLPKPYLMDWDVQIENHRVFAVNTGAAHAVIFEDEPIDVLEKGRVLRNHARFAPDGVNVNFVQQMGPNTLRLRTYEKGVEGETLACGTGAAAAAFVAHRLGRCGKEVKVLMRSEEILEITLGEEIEVTGPSVKVFDGQVKL
ncbi:MAG: Diaminopimelate epimerase [Chlamydiae bacterium]|nr:Diaminopimelate epimerase [Chlamydiota bacterium]